MEILATCSGIETCSPAAPMFRTVGVLILVVGLAGWWQLSSRSTDQAPGRPAAATTADARQQELVLDNLGKPGDPDLGRRFDAINVRHFSGAVPSMPVRWEARLTEVNALARQSYKLLGVFGQVGERAVILLDSTLRDDADARDRALCHEMVHAYLYSLGDTSADHGREFQTVLRRLSQEGAFTGMAATAEERAQLRAWLDAESARLESERKLIDSVAADLDRERAEVERTPDAARRDAYNQRAADLNRRASDFRAAQDDYNRQAARYNEMTLYPDGKN